MTPPIRQDRDALGELLIWTDVDTAHEEDFNQWYDREHMAERAAIPGFRWARRYRAQTGRRRYLALYGTESLHVFDTAAYRQAYARQTQWSLLNFARMRDTSRRVAAVTPLCGAGTGSALALLRLGTAAHAGHAAARAPAIRSAIDGVLALRVLLPDAQLSTPLPSEDASARVLEPLLLIDAASEPAAAAAARTLLDELSLEPGCAHTFHLLWELRADDLARAGGD